MPSSRHTASISSQFSIGTDSFSRRRSINLAKALRTRRSASLFKTVGSRPLRDSVTSLGSYVAIGDTLSSDSLGSFVTAPRFSKYDRTRIITRNGTFHQSDGQLNVFSEATFNLNTLYFRDVFHALVAMSTPNLLFLFFAVYVAIVFFFAFCYFLIAHFSGCYTGDNDKITTGVDFLTLSQCYFLSLETIMTIGYGTKDPFFTGCEVAIGFVLTIQSLIGILLDMFALGLIYERLSRGQSRASTVVFSDWAVIRRTPAGGHLFEFRVCDVGALSLIEPKIRLYAVRHGSYEDGRKYLYKPIPLRLRFWDHDPDITMFLCFPKTVSHEMVPTPGQTDEKSGEGERPVKCATCEERDRSPLLPPDGDFFRSYPSFHSDQKKIQKYWEKCQMEVVVLLEGTEPTTSATIQARHSYTSDEIIWNASISECVTQNDKGNCTFDFDAFHDIVPAPFYELSPVKSRPVERAISKTASLPIQSGNRTNHYLQRQKNSLRSESHVIDIKEDELETPRSLRSSRMSPQYVQRGRFGSFGIADRENL